MPLTTSNLQAALSPFSSQDGTWFSFGLSDLDRISTALTTSNQPTGADGGENRIERLTMALLDHRGFRYADDPMEYGQDAYDITNDMRAEVIVLLNALGEHRPPMLEAEIDAREKIIASLRAEDAALASTARAGAWRPMDTAPSDTPIVARHKPNSRTPHGWVATILRAPEDPDERVGGLDTILHYNGDALKRGFHGVWVGWMYPEEFAALALSAGTPAVGWDGARDAFARIVEDRAWTAEHGEARSACLRAAADIRQAKAPAVPASPISTRSGTVEAAFREGWRACIPDDADTNDPEAAAFLADLEQDAWDASQAKALSPHQGPETGGQGAGREGEGRDPEGSDYSAEPEPARGLGPSGEYSSREARLLADRNNLAAFARDILSECEDIDGGTLQELGAKHGLLVKTAFDPNRHNDDGYGLEAGDWFYGLSNLCAPCAPVDQSPQGGAASGSVGDESAVTGAAGQAPSTSNREG